MDDPAGRSLLPKGTPFGAHAIRRSGISTADVVEIVR